MKHRIASAFGLLISLFALFYNLPVRADDYKSCRQSLAGWNKCQSDADCAVIADVCGSMTEATAAAHQQEAGECNLKLRAVSKCANIDAPQDLPPMKAACEKGACKAKAVTQ